jgi:hypothetical protein
MSFRLPPRSFYGARIIDANSIDSSPNVNDLSRDPVTVRFRSIAEILLRSIRRCVTADRELDGDLAQFSHTEKPVLDNLANSLPKPLDFASENPLSVSHGSQTLGFGAKPDIHSGGKS